MAKYNNETLNPGEHFIYNEIEFICLDIIDGNYLAMTAKPWKELPFDVNSRNGCWHTSNRYNNDWRKSSLRHVLHNDFLNLLGFKYLVEQTSDLIADNGDRAYGTCGDYVTILSCDQYRKYRDFVPLFDEWMWTLTPWGCHDDLVDSARVVGTDGGLYDDLVINDYGVAPVCLFSSKNLKLCRQTHLVRLDEHDEGVDEDGE